MSPDPVERAARDLMALTSPDGRGWPLCAVVGVRRHGETTVRSVGRAAPGAAPDAASGAAAAEDATPETVFDLASVTKVAATTVPIMMLAAGDELAVDDAVRRFLPRYADPDATIRDLLTHTAGLSPWWPYYFEARDTERAFDLLFRAEPREARGGYRVYSDLGFMLLGKVVEAVTGADLAMVFHERVAAPLGLASAGFLPPAAACAVSSMGDWYEQAMVRTQTPYPVPYAPEQFSGWRTGPLRGVTNDGNAAHVFGGVSGHAGLFASVPDLLALGAALHDGRLVPASTVAAFLTPSPADATQAAGFRLARKPARGVPLAYHTGFTGTLFAFDPDDDFVLAVACMRLHRTAPADTHAPAAAQVVSGTEIARVAWQLADDLCGVGEEAA